jgi:hypothetical protein
MIGAHADPSGILRHIVDAIRSGPAKFWNHEVVNAHFLRMGLRSEFPAIVFEVSDQLFLLGVHRDYRLALMLEFLDLVVDMAKLGVAVRMRGSFQGLSIGLEAILHLMSEFGHR